MDSLGDVDNFVDRVVDRLGNEKTLSRALPNEKLSFFNEILTDADTPTIQETVYLILVF